MSKHTWQSLIENEQSHVKVDAALKTRLARELGFSLGKERAASSHRFRLFALPLTGGVVAVLILLLVLVPQNVHVLPLSFVQNGIDDWIDWNEPTDSIATSRGMKNTNASAAISGSSNPFATASSLINSASSYPSNAMPSSIPDAAGRLTESALGYSVGGAKDVGNFRENIKKGYMPLATDITYEGLFYDYFFDTHLQKPCTELFCPSYARALSRDPQTGAEEYYLSVGLNSNIKEKDFHRPKTNFVVVLDISGSMGSPFDEYYYDQTGARVKVVDGEARKTKMELAGEALSALVDQLKPDDRLGIVLFSDSAKVAKPLGLVGETDRERLKQHLMELEATNGTNMSAGLEEGTALLRDRTESEGYAHRLIFITDAMPNRGTLSTGDLGSIAQKNAEQGIAMTFIGIGVDFQSELVESLTKVRGANYLSVHSAEEFKKRLGEQFDFLVTPLVYDLSLALEGSGYAIDKVYGSPDTDVSNGNILHVRTLFPSKTENGETRGGLVLLKLKKLSDQPTFVLRAKYEDTNGQIHVSEEKVLFTDMAADSYDGLGIRKGILLARYGELIKSWLTSENGAFETGKNGQWERSSHPLRISQTHQAAFSSFSQYFRTEAEVLRDKTLDQEQRILDRLTTFEATAPQEDWIF